jgi:hypothetical protein
LEPKDFTYQIEKTEGEIMLNLYFEKRLPDTKLLQLIPKKEIILVNEFTKKTILIFRNRAAEYSIEVLKKPNAELMDGLTSFGANSRIATIVISTLSLVMAFLVIVSSSGLGAPIMKFFRVFKLISRLKLVNIYFGAYLEIFLVISGNLYKLGGDEISMRALKFGANSKGKLKFYRVTVIAIDKLAIPFTIFFTLIAMRIYNQVISKYVKKMGDYSAIDEVVHLICDKARIVILTTIGIDIIFYSMHCVAHLELSTWYSHRDPGISLILSILAIIFVLSEFMGLLGYADRTRFLFRKDLVRKDLKYKHLFEKEKNAPKELPSNCRLHVTSGDPTELADRSGDEKLNSVHPKTSENSPPRKNAEEAAALNFAGFDPSNPNKKRKLPLMFNTSTEEFIADGIKVEKLETFTGRYANTLSLMRLFSFEPIFVGLQMFPGVQLILLSLVEIAYISFIFKAGFKDKIFVSKVALFENILNELSIAAFLGVGLFFHFSGGQKNISEALFEMLQYVVIGFIAVSVLMGLISLLVSIIMAILNILKGKELKKFIKKLREQKELDRLVSRKRVYADPVPKKALSNNLRDIDFYGLTEEEILWHVSRGNIELNVARHLIATKYNEEINVDLPVFVAPVAPVEIKTVKQGHRTILSLEPKKVVGSKELPEGPNRDRQEEFERKEQQRKRREKIEKNIYKDLF